MSLKLIDESDESYSPKHKDILMQAHQFLNSKDVFLLDKLMLTGIIDVPESVKFEHKFEQISEGDLKIILGQINKKGLIQGVAKTINII